MNIMRSALLLTLLWVQCQLAEPRVQAASHSLFDGKSFAGWEGDTNHWWRIEKGMLVGGSLTQKIPDNQFLATTKAAGKTAAK